MSDKDSSLRVPGASTAAVAEEESLAHVAEKVTSPSLSESPPLDSSLYFPIDSFVADSFESDKPVKIDPDSLEFMEEGVLKNKEYKGLLNDVDNIHLPNLFNQSLELNLRLHEDCLLNLRRDFLENSNLQLQSEIQSCRTLLDFKLSILNKAYRTHISALGRNYLIREVIKSKKVQDQKEEITKTKISFLVLVRAYEKLSSFNEKAKEFWNEIFILLMSLRKLPNSRNFVIEFEKLYIEKIRSLLNNTDFLLSRLYDYLVISSEKKDKSGNTKVSASFSEEKSYQIADVIAQIPNDLLQKTEKIISIEKERLRNLNASLIRDERSNLHAFPVQKTFFLFREQRSDQKQYSRINTKIKGSHDWNRKELYHFEMSLMELEFCMRHFDNCYLLELNESSKDISLHYKVKALKKRGTEREKLKDYEEIEVQILNELASEIIEKDFPQLREAQVFLYHCTPHLLYKLLLEEFRQRQFGLAYYVDRNGECWHSYPESFIKKIFISWWEEYFAKLDAAKVDSYFLYSQQVRTLQNMCEELYQKARAEQKITRDYLSLQELEEWLWENRGLIFGKRRNEIFLRFNVKVNNARALRQANQYILQRLGV